MRQIRFLSVGRFKSPAFQELAADYTKRLARYYPVQENVIKDAPGNLPAKERVEREGKSILAQLGSRDLAICLDERGQAFSSPKLAKRLQGWLEDPGAAPCFIVGGSHGLADGVKSRCAVTLSLGSMTLPHELARVVLAEQLYRAATILHGHPYHHG